MTSSSPPPVCPDTRPPPTHFLSGLRRGLVTEEELSDDSWVPDVMGSGKPGLTKDEYLCELRYIKTRLEEDRHHEESSRAWEQEMADFMWKRRCSLVFSALLVPVIGLLVGLNHFLVFGTMHPLCHEVIPGQDPLIPKERCWEFAWDNVAHAMYLPLALVVACRECKSLWLFGLEGVWIHDPITPPLQGFLMLFSILIWTLHLVMEGSVIPLTWTQGVSLFPLVYASCIHTVRWFNL